jgi:electron transfer flavoprotein alpha subunit
MAKKVWVVLQHRDGKLHRMSREAVAAGQQLAAVLGGSAEALVLGGGEDLAREAAAFRLAGVRHLRAPILDAYTPGAYVAALAASIGQGQPDFVVFPHTYQSVDFFPRLAHEVAAGLVPEVTGFRAEAGELHFSRPILGGKMVAQVKVRGEGLVLVSVQSGAFSADGAEAGEAPVTTTQLDLKTTDREILGVEEVGGEQVDLTKSEIIVAVGRGVGGADKMGPTEELARVLGAELGASRPVIDSGWLPRDRQIGSSGQTVAPKLYIALGISGAIQHLVGMKGSTTVVAVNKDPGAPIFTVANYGIVGDLHEIVPALTAALREAQG